jgi:hypothetical protein
MYSSLNKAFSAVALALVALAIFVGARAGTEAPPAGPPKFAVQHEILIYYANETPADAASSVNYLLLFDALRAAGDPELAQQIDALKDDAEKFPALIERQIGIIAAAAKEAHFTALIFTNALARRRKLLLLEAGALPRELEAFGTLGVPSSGPLRASPLSRPEALRAALEAAAALPQTRGRPAILITTSHGDDTMAVMPRVVADLALLDRDAFVAALRKPSATGPGGRVVPIGISKIAYWNALATMVGNIQFALVFREACRSGIGSLAEFAVLPSNVAIMAHAGRRNIGMGDVDYAKLFSGLSSEQKLSQQLADRLLQQDIEVSSPFGTLATLAWQATGRVVPVTLFIPLGVWIVWAARRIGSRPPVAIRGD